jgi:hypothetical protein
MHVIGLEIRGFKPGRGRQILKVINIHSKTSFGEELKPSVPYRNILRHLKDPTNMKKILRRQSSSAVFAQYLLVQY